MKLTTLLLLLVSYSSMTAVYAQDGSKVNKSSAELTEQEKEDREQEEFDKKVRRVNYQNSFPSKYNRENKKASLALSTGFTYSSGSVGLSASLFLDEDTMLSASFYDLSDDNRDSSDYEEGYAAQVSFKQFSGNSFYVEPFLYYRDIKENDTDPFIFSFSEPERYQYRIRDIGVGVKIGNQWQWKNLTVGCDWVGLNRQVSRLEEEGNSDFLSENESRFQFTLLNFYVGASF